MTNGMDVLKNWLPTRVCAKIHGHTPCKDCRLSCFGSTSFDVGALRYSGMHFRGIRLFGLRHSARRNVMVSSDCSSASGMIGSHSLVMMKARLQITVAVDARILTATQKSWWVAVCSCAPHRKCSNVHWKPSSSPRFQSSSRREMVCAAIFPPPR